LIFLDKYALYNTTSGWVSLCDNDDIIDLIRKNHISFYEYYTPVEQQICILSHTENPYRYFYIE
jgi:hypothetical protein